MVSAIADANLASVIWLLEPCGTLILARSHLEDNPNLLHQAADEDEPGSDASVDVAGLDADLLAVLPAFSRHPSLKHLMLGKNFNIKGR